MFHMRCFSCGVFGPLVSEALPFGMGANSWCGGLPPMNMSVAYLSVLGAGIASYRIGGMQAYGPAYLPIGHASNTKLIKCKRRYNSLAKKCLCRERLCPNMGMVRQYRVWRRRKAVRGWLRKREVPRLR